MYYFDKSVFLSKIETLRNFIMYDVLWQYIFYDTNDLVNMFPL